jgi:hypothetical protein
MFTACAARFQCCELGSAQCSAPLTPSARHAQRRRCTAVRQGSRLDLLAHATTKQGGICFSEKRGRAPPKSEPHGDRRTARLNHAPCDDHMRGETTWTSSPTRNGRVKGVRHRRVRLHRKQRLARQPPQASARRPQPTLHRPPRTTWPQAGRAPSCTCMLDGARLGYRECQARWRTIASSASSGWLPQRGWQLTTSPG